MATAISPMLELNNGVEMPALGLGVFQSQPAETVGAVESAIEDGYRLIDTAAAYMNEQEVGEGVRRTGIDRGQIFVTTKLWISDYGYEPALRGFDGCLGDSASTTSTWSCCIIRYRTNSTGRWPRTRPPSRCLLTGGYVQSWSPTRARSRTSWKTPRSSVSRRSTRRRRRRSFSAGTSSAASPRSRSRSSHVGSQRTSTSSASGRDGRRAVRRAAGGRRRPDPADERRVDRVVELVTGCGSDERGLEAAGGST
jgi:hypothetical protein